MSSPAFRIPAVFGLAFVRVRYLVEYGLLRLAAGLMRMMSVDRASRIMGKLWRTIAPLTPRHRRALSHVAAAYPDMDAAGCEALVRDMWENLGRITAETFHLDRLADDLDRYTYDIGAAKMAIEQSGGACVVVSLHTGNWELSAQPARMAGIPVAGVYQALKNPLADAYLNTLRAPYYPGGLYSKGHDTSRKLLAYARGGGAIAFLADLRDIRGSRVPFFGREAWATPFPIMIARSCGVPVVATRSIRKAGVAFHFEARILDIPRDGGRKTDIEAGTTMMHQLFEEWIREYPAQWMWIHRKWARNGSDADNSETD